MIVFVNTHGYEIFIYFCFLLHKRNSFSLTNLVCACVLDVLTDIECSSNLFLLIGVLIHIFLEKIN
jgi:hypothetical protein